MEYYSERQGNIPIASEEEITESAWNGIRILIDRLITDGSFGAMHPESCYDDKTSTVGTDENAFWEAMKSEILTLAVHHSLVEYQGYRWQTQPPTIDVLDMIEFCWHSVGKPKKQQYHSYFRHHELDYDIEEGREDFRERINRIFRRNGIVYNLTPEGQIERLLSPTLDEALRAGSFSSSDSELDQLLLSARSKISNPDIHARQEALKDLWDAWERLKTMYGSGNKKSQASAMLDIAAGGRSPKFRTSLETEAMELTRLGNDLFIRHSETSQEKLVHGEHIDYLFHRMFSIIDLILKSAGQVVR